ncbi:MAG: hypothetical protein JKX93_07035 [Rhizobiaceae bacterium]|nr:hypothetical protein [Rhizobiaceae bacterium]
MNDIPRSDQDNIWIGALEYAPEIASRIGLYVAQMTGFELQLNGLFNTLSGAGDMRVGEIVLGRLLSISLRLEILKDLAKLDQNSMWQPKLDELLKRASSINVRRNEYVHGTYRVNETTGSVQLITWVTSENRKSKIYNLSESCIDADILEVREYLGDVLSLFKPDSHFPRFDAATLPSKDS